MRENIEKSVKECEEIFQRMKNEEEYAQKEIVKYFDRIHDKLFAYHLFFLAGYISLIEHPDISISIWCLLIPVFCVIRLIYIDWKMMERNRKTANFTNLKPKQIDDLNKEQNSINRYSLEVVLETIITTIGFMWAFF